MNRIVFFSLVILTTFLMGSTFAIGKWGMVYASPLLLIASRFTLAGLILAVFVKGTRKPHPIKRTDWGWMAAIGFFQTTCAMGFIFLALRTVTAGETAILTFINPLLVIVFGTVCLRVRYRLQQWVGVLFGFIGVFITMGAHLEFRIGTVFGLLSAVTWAIATLLMKTKGHRYDTWVVSAYQMLFGGLFLFLASFLLEEPFFIIHTYSLLLIIWLTLAASIVQFTVWFYLLKKGDPERTSAFLFLAPFFSILSGWLILDEQLHWTIWVGGAAIFLGIFLVNWKLESPGWWKSQRVAKDAGH
ncbi:DMT family transporter [Sporosarcina sp. 179-K 3D1 HS]|uniref:DMT family transporter n=1 Tax=Sporosarcina sp. 179-K 3D1 HS TaxID=3232169 RepID=UPI0039A22E2E